MSACACRSIAAANKVPKAEAEKLRAGSELQVQSQQVAAELRAQYVLAQQTSELLKIHREGLSPQSRSEFQAALATYQSNKQDFQAMLAAFLDVLHLDEAYWQSVAEYAWRAPVVCGRKQFSNPSIF